MSELLNDSYKKNTHQLIIGEKNEGVTSVIRVDKHWYGISCYNLYCGSGLACQNFMTGEIVWAEKEKIGKGAVSFADGMLYFCEERSGDMVLATVELLESGKNQNWAPLALAEGKLLIRDQKQMRCVVVR